MRNSEHYAQPLASFAGDKTNAENIYRCAFKLSFLEMSEAIHLQTMVNQKLWIYLKIDREVYVAGVAQLNGVHQDKDGEYTVHLLSNVDSLKFPKKEMYNASFELYVATVKGIDEVEQELGISSAVPGSAMSMVSLKNISFQLDDEKPKNPVGRPPGSGKKNKKEALAF